ncbi:MAG: DNA-directed RNA polymerase subunit omega [Gemmatimonadales bacterium]|nr:DNA-directed RNA polymerase subunit omega [Gemmatimonadales bacterium]
MRPTTDYIRHAARLARQLQLEAATGATAPPGEDFYKTLNKAFEEIAAGLEMVSTRD